MSKIDPVKPIDVRYEARIGTLPGRFASWSYRDWDGASDADKNAFLEWRLVNRPEMRDVDFIEMPARKLGPVAVFQCECGFACAADFSAWLGMICPSCGVAIAESDLMRFEE